MHEFVKRSWHIIEPGIEFVDNWHIVAICNYLEACVRGEIKNLIINIPPRHMKSLITNVFFPAWVWTFAPEKKFIFTSYAERLATRDSVKCRKLIESEWYQQRFELKLADDNNQKTQYDNEKGGYRYSFGFNSVTGQGGDFVVIDDPLDAEKRNSVLELDNVNYTYDNVLYNRLNDLNTGVRILIMQRLNSNDLVSHVLENKTTYYEQLILPAEYEGERFQSSIGFVDPRKEKGELLWPNKFNKEQLDALKGTLGDAGYASQYQQRPYPVGGFIFKKNWFTQRYDRQPNYIARYISWDTAQSVGVGSAYSACTVGELLPDYRLRIIEVFRKKLEMPQLVDTVEMMGKKYRDKLQMVVIESKSTGLSVIQTLRQSSDSSVRGILYPFKPESDKESRGSLASIWAENGSVLLPPPSDDYPWLFDFEEEFFSFPNSKYKDQTDSFNQLILYLQPILSRGYRARTDTRKFKNSVSNNYF